MNLFDLQRKLKNLDVSALQEIAIEENSNIVTDLQRKQLLASKTSKGTDILPKYSDAYAKKKGKSDPDLFVTGEWQNEITAFVESGEVDIVSLNEKSQWLVPRYENLLGLNVESKKTLNPIVTNSLARLFKDELNLQG